MSAKRDMNKVELKAIVNLMFIYLQQGKIKMSIDLFEQFALLPFKNSRGLKHLNAQIHFELSYQVSIMLFDKCQDDWGAINRIDSFCKRLEVDFGDEKGFENKVAAIWW